MPGDGNQRNVFEFFREHLGSKETFCREDVEQLTDWKGQTFGTYWSKQLRPLVIEISPGRYRVGEVFRRYSEWERFRQHVTQMRPTSGDYKHTRFHVVRVYEFFMPLSNENHLRDALDALFFLESIEAQLRTIPPVELEKKFPRGAGEADPDYQKRLCAWISDHFGGYSIYHVNGRYRAMALSRRSDVLDGRTRYLVDETTAVTRFIFPCADEDEARTVAFFFEHLFVAAIIEMVNGEDEIWMVESGFENQLHIWRVDNR
jgi:hypothetical protein